MFDWLFSLFRNSDNYTEEQMMSDHDDSVANFLSYYSEQENHEA